jgi:hypothetical protein
MDENQQHPEEKILRMLKNLPLWHAEVNLEKMLQKTVMSLVIIHITPRKRI